MNYFIYKQGSGIAPQAGYEIHSMHKGDSETWWLASTTNSVETIQALSLETKVIGIDPDADITAKFPDLISQKAAKIRGEGSLRLTTLNDQAGGYFKEERETWYVQKAEAEAYLAWDGTGEAPSTPMLSALVANRADLDTVADIAALVHENTTLLEVASGAILGKQQTALTEVFTAVDLVTALNVTFPE